MYLIVQQIFLNFKVLLVLFPFPKGINFFISPFYFNLYEFRYGLTMYASLF